MPDVDRRILGAGENLLVTAADDAFNAELAVYMTRVPAQVQTDTHIA